MLESKWAKSDEKSQAIFTTRESVVDFLETMLRHKFFHRARKIIVRAEPKKKKTDEVESSAAEDVREKKEKLKEKKKTDKKAKDDSEEKVEKRKEKKKVKLDMHLEQIYVDGNEVFYALIFQRHR